MVPLHLECCGREYQTVETVAPFESGGSYRAERLLAMIIFRGRIAAGPAARLSRRAPPNARAGDCAWSHAPIAPSGESPAAEFSGIRPQRNHLKPLSVENYPEKERSG
jgi:hypothetical protein